MARTKENEGNGDRVPDILEAACRVIARTGLRKLRMQDVAAEAGVSKALIHYYVKTREDLLARAYVHGDAKSRQRFLSQIDPLEPAATRVTRLLLFYFDDEEVARRDWLIWSELSSLAVFEKELQPILKASFAQWTGWLEQTIRQGVSDGSVPKNVDPEETAIRLTALIDGLGAAYARRLINRVKAKDILAKALQREFGLKSEPEEGLFMAKADRASVAGYLVELANLTRNAVEGLETFAATPEEYRSIAKVGEMLQRLAPSNPRRISSSRSAAQAKR